MRPRWRPVPRRKCRRRRSGDRPRRRRRRCRAGGGQHLGVDVAAHELTCADSPASRPPSWPASRAPRRWRRRCTRCAAGARRAPSGPRPGRGSDAPRGRRRSGWWSGSSRTPATRRSPARPLQPLQVAAEVAVPGLAQPARQAAVDHGLLAGVQADAGALVDQLADAVEVGAVRVNSWTESAMLMAAAFLATGAAGAGPADAVRPWCGRPSVAARRGRDRSIWAATAVQFVPAPVQPAARLAARPAPCPPPP
jgi:hypothetical protein